MRAVVDTNVIAYFLLGTEPFVEETEAFWRIATRPMAPVSWEAEIANVLWMAARAGVVTPLQAVAKLDYAAALGIDSVPIRALWGGALMRSIQRTVAVYDSLFVELAERERLALITFDGAVLKAFPGTARRPRDALAGSGRSSAEE